MKMPQTLHITTREDWRDWLLAHHASVSEVWLIYHKASTGKPRIPYNDAVEEAICFGWIDSLVQRIDDETFAQKFTPRKNSAKWSPANIARLKRMVKAGRMTPAGMAVSSEALVTARLPKAKTLAPGAGELTPDELEERLRQHPRAWTYFETLAPSYRKNYLAWIRAAKRPQTRERRLHESIELLSKHQKLGLK